MNSIRASWWKWAAAAVACRLLYFHGMGLRGLVGPDEPRYASIARAMAESGDWVTPRLNGTPWFEKPALLYWMGAAAELLGAPEDQATRIPVALIACAFLIFFYLRLRAHFGGEAAGIATLVLGTSAGFVTFANVGVFDLPLTAATGAALLLLLDWAADAEDKRRLPWFGAALGVGLLAKGLVAPVIAAVAVLSVVRDRGIFGPAKDLFALRVLGPFLLTAGPWYALCWWRNGRAFFDEFIWRHHVMRLYSPEIEHVQPWWFYLPVLAAALLPWTPLLGAVRWKGPAGDARLRLLMWWAAGGFVFFSLATNKLPGYILPILPPLAALIGVALSQSELSRRRASWGWFAAAGATLALLAVAQTILPAALADGITDAWPPERLPPAGIAVALIAVVAGAVLAARGRIGWAAAVLAALTTISLAGLKTAVFEPLDRAAGARALWREIEPRAAETCVGEVRRHVEYGLGFYGGDALPRCDEESRPLRVTSDPPRIEGEEPYTAP